MSNGHFTQEDVLILRFYPRLPLLISTVDYCTRGARWQAARISPGWKQRSNTGGEWSQSARLYQQHDPHTVSSHQWSPNRSPGGYTPYQSFLSVFLRNAPIPFFF
ncbi:hypothetical protein BaRGS_00014634 [Batillaria attramentaria]|uniref:Uncharacterized protein n=1 Tax=Batillaria attramentaria TaxID=370345 RepID=A0ABD0L4E6_9CAEN